MLTSRSRISIVLAFSLTVFLLPLRAADDDPCLRLAPHLDALLNVIKGKTGTYTLTVEGALPGSADKLTIKLGRAGERRFFASVDGPRDVKGALVFSPERIFIDLPAKNTAFLAQGELPAGADAVQPEAIFKAALKLHPLAEEMWPIFEKNDGLAAAGALSPLLNATRTEVEKTSPGTDYITIRPGGGKLEIQLVLRAGKWCAMIPRGGGGEKDTIDISLVETCALPELPADHKTVAVARGEMERALQRGSLRGLDILADDFHSKAPADKVTEIAGARLEIKDGQRTCWLTGTPYEMGKRHGELLKAEMRKVTDSTLYVVGFAYSVAKGSWFLNDIRDAWKRLEPHCDKAHLEELRGLAEGSGIAYDEGKIANVFPELFHCSGFAISGDATVGGKLYHGRVLDYMTQIGLQHAQVDFITKREGCRGFVNIGYAGFIGCVSGMNDAQISLGEMGGRGEGNWDGTPMAFLMRQVLEKSENLNQALKIFANAKRTCEYYYIVADGKTRSAVGVAAWPEKIQFIKQGEAHERLPNVFPGCVLLSAGDRYNLLSQRTKDGFGKLDEQGAIELMSRPVAMGSNLHNVLFVPEDQTYHVAHASLRGHQPAAMQKYVKHDLKANLAKLGDIKNGKLTSGK